MELGIFFGRTPEFFMCISNSIKTHMALRKESIRNGVLDMATQVAKGNGGTGKER